MRLEDRPHALRAVERARGLDRRRDLGRVVGVVVDDQRARRRRPQALEAPAGAGEVGQRARGGGGVGAGQRACFERGRGVARVVQAGDAQAHLEPAPREARAARRQRDAGGVVRHDGAVAQREEVRTVPDDRLGRAGQERAIGVAQLAERRVRGVVVELDVGEHGDVDVQAQHRAVGLVGLDDQPLPRPPRRVRAGRRQRAADEVAGIEPAADGDDALEGGELGEQVGARVDGQAAVERGEPLGVVGRDGAREDDLDVAAWGHVGRIVAGARVDAGRPQAGQRRRIDAVAAAHRRAERGRDERVAAHARAADPHDVQAPAGPRSRRFHGVGHGNAKRCPRATLP